MNTNTIKRLHHFRKYSETNYNRGRHRTLVFSPTQTPLPERAKKQNGRETKKAKIKDNK